LRATFNVPVVELGFTTFRAGDVFVEFYYWQRWYNVFQVSDAERRLKGWYANVGRPAELDRDGARAELRYVDLVLDVWSDPGGRSQVLDEDECASLVKDGAVSPAARAGAVGGRAALVALAESRSLPRWPCPAPAACRRRYAGWARSALPLASPAS